MRKALEEAFEVDKFESGLTKHKLWHNLCFVIYVLANVRTLSDFKRLRFIILQ